MTMGELVKKKKEDMKKDKAWTKKKWLCRVLSLNLEAIKDAKKDAKSCKSCIYLLNKYLLTVYQVALLFKGLGILNSKQDHVTALVKISF